MVGKKSNGKHPTRPRSAAGAPAAGQTGTRPAAERLELRALFSAQPAGDLTPAVAAAVGSPFEAHVSFQPAAAPTADGYVPDAGAVLGDRGNGMTYGWTANLSKKTKARAAKRSSDTRFADPKYGSFVAIPKATAWNIAVPNGTYTVHVVAGDSKSTSGRYNLVAEGVSVVNAKVSKKDRWVEGTATVTVADGMLTVQNAPKTKSGKINFIDIAPAAAAVPDTSGLTLALVNSATGQDVGTLTDGATLDLDTLGTQLSVRGDVAADKAADVKSVVFNFDATFHTESVAPYSIAGDADGKFDAVPLSNGSHFVTLTPYDAAGGKGTAGEAKTVQFTVTNAPAAPAPDPNAAPAITWTPNGPTAPMDRTEAEVTQVGGKLYVFGGFTTELPGFLPVTHRSDVLDLTTGIWTRIADLPEGAAVNHGATTTDGRFIYLVAGQVDSGYGTATKDAFRYDTQTDTWTEIASLPAARYGGGLALIDGKLHYFGGDEEDRTTVTTEHFVLDTTNPAAQWTTGTPLPLGGDHLAHTIIDGNLYVTGGEHGHHPKGPPEPKDTAPYITHKYLFRYNAADDSWTRLADMPVSVSHHEATTLAINGKIVTFGGILFGNTTTDNIQVYDPATNKWTLLESKAPYSFDGGVASYFNGRIYLTNGYSPNPPATGITTGWYGTPTGI